jgi:tetratricopeptide (TPR) repeat protein
MSRFVNLELGGESEEQYSEKGLVRDEPYYLREGQAAFENAEFEKALRLYAKVLEYNPQNASAWTAQARLLIELGEYREAKLWADKALERFPNEAELLAVKAVALGRSGECQSALAFSDASIEERGAQTPYVWLARGDVLLACREARADYCLEKALMLAPRNSFIAWLAARIRFHYEQFAVALKILQEAVQWNTGHFLLWLDLGRCQEALGFVDAAQISYTQALDLNGNCEGAQEALNGLASRGLGGRVRGLWRRLVK